VQSSKMHRPNLLYVVKHQNLLIFREQCTP